MNRRELLKLIAAATGGIVIGGEFLLSGCTNPESSGGGFAFTEDNIAFLDEIAEAILPQTSTAGAKAAGVGRFMTVMVNDCYTKEDQEIFHKGLGILDEACKKMHDHGFMKATPEQRKELLISVDKETKEYIKKKADFDNDQKEKEKQGQEKGTDFKKQTMPNHYFQQLKQLAIFGYFTSEKGRTEGLRYTPVPGKYEGVIDYKKGDKAFVGLT